MGSTTTNKTTIPPPSPEELGLINLATDGLMMSYLEDAGYDVTKNQSKWQDSTQYKDIQDQKEKLNSQITQLQSNLSKINPNSDPYGYQSLQNQISGLQKQGEQLSAKETQGAQDFKPAISYDTRKKADLQTEMIREKYGADSEEYKTAKADYDKNKADQEQQQNHVQVLALDATEKFLKGDYSLNDSQKQFLDDTLGPIKTAGLQAVDFLKQEAGLTEGKLNAAADNIKGEYLSTDKNLRADLENYKSAVQDTSNNLNTKINDFMTQVKQTGLDMGDAITELESRTKQTGVDMKTALNQSIEMTKSLNEMGIQDYSLQTRNKIAQQAASLGRSPTDPEFIKQMQTAVNRQITETNLSLGQYAAEKGMDIASQTGQGMQNAAQLRLSAAQLTGQGLQQGSQMGYNAAQLTGQGMQNAAQMGMGVSERTGAGLEGVANTKLGIAERTGGINEEAARLRGQVGVGSAENYANMSTQLGMSQVPGMVGLGINMGQYNMGVNQTRLANSQAAMSAPMGLAGYYQGDRRAQPTSVSKTSPGIGSIIGGVIGTGISGLGAASSMGFI